jgi:hypothetical protein
LGSFAGTRPDPLGASLLRQGDALLFPAIGGNTVSIRSTAGSDAWIFSLPPSNGDPLDVLSTDGNGAATWVPLTPAPVDSVFTRTGAVVAEAGDYAAFYDPLGAASDVQDNLDSHAADPGDPHAAAGYLTETDADALYDPLGSAAGVQANLDTHEGDDQNPHDTTFLLLDDTPVSMATGDLFYAGSPAAVVGLPVGANGQFLTVTGGLPVWEAVPGGVSTFLQLTDTPVSYAGQQGLVVAVNAAENALEFIVGGGGGVSTWLQLTDTPNSYAGQQFLSPRVNAAEDAIEFVDLDGLYDPLGAASAAVAAHEADAGDPHAAAAYLKAADGDLLYDPLGAAAGVQGNLDTHIADAADPHAAAGYLKQADADLLYDPLGAADTVQGNLDAHTGDTNNPHATTFIVLPDTPPTYAGAAGQALIVEPGETGLIFVDAGEAAPALAQDLHPLGSERPTLDFGTVVAYGDDFVVGSFLGGVDEYLYWTVLVPDTWTGGDPTFSMSVGGQGPALDPNLWEVGIQQIIDDSTDVTNAGTFNIVGSLLVPQSAPNQKQTVVISGAYPGLLPGQMIRVRIGRLGSDPSDTGAFAAFLYQCGFSEGASA